MPRQVILSVQDGSWNKWGDQFVKALPLQRAQNLILRGVTAEQAKTKLIRAAAAAAGGTLIISVGHGGSGTGAAGEGFVDLAPGGVLRLGGLNASTSPAQNNQNYVSVFYDVALNGPPAISDYQNDVKYNPTSTRLKRWKVYQEICKGFKSAGLREIVLLSCNVGNATDFVRKLARDWGTVIRAYKVKVALDTNPKRYLLYLINNPPPYKLAVDTIAHEEQLPSAPAQTVLIGPPP
jgi:hypothetical protein